MKKILLSVALMAMMLVMTGCQRWMDELDVVGNGSISALGAAFSAVPGGAEANDRGGWSLTAPDGAARFVWGGGEGAMIEVDAQPFLDAGLNPGEMDLRDGWLVIGDGLGGSDGADSEPLAAYERIVRQHGDRIGYHMAMDHFNIDVGGGNLFEWAKDMDASDKDIVFAMNPAPFIAAGVDPNVITGWTFAKVPVHANGKQIEIDMLLKPFDLQ